MENTYDYYPFGSIQGQTENISNTYKFTGQEWDDGYDTYHFWARGYDPKIGRWTGVDPIIYPSQSPYSYCFNSPMNYIDPSGMGGRYELQLREAFSEGTGQWDLIWLWVWVEDYYMDDWVEENTHGYNYIDDLNEEVWDRWERVLGSSLPRRGYIDGSRGEEWRRDNRQSRELKPVYDKPNKPMYSAYQRFWDHLKNIIGDWKFEGPVWEHRVWMEIGKSPSKEFAATPFPWTTTVFWRSYSYSSQYGHWEYPLGIISASDYRYWGWHFTGRKTTTQGYIIGQNIIWYNPTVLP